MSDDNGKTTFRICCDRFDRFYVRETTPFGESTPLKALEKHKTLIQIEIKTKQNEVFALEADLRRLDILKGKLEEVHDD